MVVHASERVPGFDPRGFWQQSPPPRHWDEALRKYEALAELARLPDDRARQAALREAARRWPAALREAELVGPARVDARLALARERPAGTRSALAERPEAAAVLAWALLHELIRDQLRWRAQARGEADSEGFASWVQSAGDEALAARWPSPERIVDVTGPKLRVRGAYLWLAARAGLSLPALNELLFARRGHWDRREGDPAWAHEA